MRNLLNPKWLFIVNTLPIAALLVLFLGQFNIIKTLLDEKSIRLWMSFGSTLIILGLLNFVYTAYSVYKKQNVSALYAIAALLCYIPFIYLYGYCLDQIIPFDIPQWMISGNIFLYVGTFLMPTLAYSLFVLVSHFTPETKEYRAWVNFLIAVSIPVSGYLFSQIVLPLWQPVAREFSIHALLILIIATTIVFLFFLVRGIFILAAQKAVAWRRYQLVWKIPLAVVLPLLGLLVNNGHLWANTFFSYNPGINPGIFGNFHSHWFYILAVLNGILICLPNLENKLYRLFLFIGRSITFAYTFYFFLVFLPFLPLSVVAIIAIGTGFLTLTPLLLFIIHINEISRDFKYLRTLFPQKLIIGVLTGGFLIIPAFITAAYLRDKSVLNETLGYLYSPDYSKKYNINKTSLQKTLNVLRNHKSRDRDFILSNQIPYLSSYFNWLVLDNLTLSDAKINYIKKIFFGSASFELSSEIIQNDNVKITNVSTNSVYDKSQNAWKSRVDLEITNKNANTRFAEYATIIDLPEGCWISDYYLFVEGKKEYGILAEKKSAMWVFSNIRNENRDPGILYYLTGNKVAFRVFPFAKNEVRKTGIEFLHKDPVKLRIDGNAIELGNAKENVTENTETENVVYISAQQKQALKPVSRKPYFHFLVDTSKDKDEYVDDFTRRIDQFLKNHAEFSENAQIGFVNSYINSFQLDNNWKQHYELQNFEGGFFLDRAIKTALLKARKDESYPVIVVVTDNIQSAVVDKDFSDFKFAFPENNLFFNLDKNGNYREHSLIDNPKEQLPIIKRECRFCSTVLEYKLSDNSIVYLPNNYRPSIILKKDIFKVTEQEIKEKNWQSALTMQAKWMSQILHPETSNKEWLNLVQYSFISKVMTPVTSYIAVENEAQKAMLKKKQEQVLSGNKSLDLADDVRQMSEPNLWILAVLLGIALWYGKKRKQQSAES